ncbi:hypothetical protein [Azospirillum sp. TSO5]|uniref:hypothetical protein n=1 Tax=Azospirillum sp. TSO5 TaxID=716760 RepID=UPI000D612384|nr:hypothetical protein [Azospirillum sp. TSO5]PWC92902.1 hypothetical protein TSO5_15860 [Azospirillum sp. TSO5]
MDTITDVNTDIDVFGIVQKGQADDRLPATAALVVAVLRALRDNVSAESVDNMSCSRADMTLTQLAMGLREHDGFFGISFEHAIHLGVAQRMQPMYGYVCAALRNMFGWDWPIESVIYGIEKRDHEGFLGRFDELFGEDPTLVTVCNKGTPLTKELFTKLRKPKEWLKLPDDLRGLYKTDLFFGSREQRRWTSVSIKSRSGAVEDWPGIALAIYPYDRKKEKVVGDFVMRNMGKVTAHLPIALDDSFMFHFHSAFRLVDTLVEKRFDQPEQRVFYDPVERWLANFLCDRRKDRIADVEEALAKQIGTVETKSVYLPGTSGLITDPEEVWKQLPNDLKQRLLFSALPIYAESPTLNSILRP